MARDPLRILLSIRQRAVEQARSELAGCLAAEVEIMDSIRLHDEAGRRDREISDAWQDAHQFQEILANRQEILRANRDKAAAALVTAEALSADARRVVTTAQSAAEAVDQLIDEREAIKRAEAAKREQHMLDDIARARHAARQRIAVAKSCLLKRHEPSA